LQALNTSWSLQIMMTTTTMMTMMIITVKMM